MKTNRFLAYLAIAVLGCSFAVSCDDNDNPPAPPQDPNYNDTIIYIDERTDDEKYNIDGDYFIRFDEESFDGYRVVVTRRVGDSSYEIYIPQSGTDITLKHSNEKYLGTYNNIFVNDMSLPLTEELSGNANNAGTIRFFKRYNEYLSVEYAKHHELNFKVPMNEGTERRIKIGVYEDTPAPGFAYIVFVQAGK